MNPPRDVYLTVYHDAVKAEIRDIGDRRKMVGWFKDEVCATAAVLERLLFCSSFHPQDRTLPEIVIHPERQQEWSKRKLTEFSRGIRVKHEPQGRRIIRMPGTFNKPWVADCNPGGI